MAWPRGAALAAAIALAGAACGGGDAAESPRRGTAAFFAYDRSAPLGLRDRGIINRADYPIKVRDVSFVSPRGGRVPAYLIVPPGEGP